MKPTAKCNVCDRAIAAGHTCPECRTLSQRLHAAHLRWYQEECEADRAARSLRVRLYSRIVADGLRLFEDTPARMGEIGGVA